MTTYSDIKNSAEYRNDRACCTVVATAIVLDEEFKTVQLEMAKAGRIQNRGFSEHRWWDKTQELAKAKGYKVRALTKKELNELTGGKTMTCNNAPKYLDKRKNYVLSVKDHVAAVKAGVVEDWSAGKKKPVERLYEITPPNSEPQTTFAQLVAAL